MKPTLFQRLFTDNRPVLFLMGIGAAALVVWTGSILFPTLTVSLWSVGQFVILVAMAACLGVMLAAFPGGMLLGFVLRWVECKNGAPFHKGDEVIILSKRFPGRVARVYEVWADRHEVRLELGEDERQKVTDVFSYTDVCRRAASSPLPHD